MLNNDSGALYAVAINLYELGLNDLDYVILQRKGDYDNGPNADTFTGMTAVFSSNDSLLEPALLNRVPGAREAGEDFVTHNTYYGNLSTDIPEDFYVDSVVIQIPDSAKYLFAGPHDAWFHDNSDPDHDFGIRIVKTEVDNIKESGLSGIITFELIQNYPNPFNPITNIEFRIAKSEFVTLNIYDVKGQVVKRPIGQIMTPGVHQYQFDGSGLASGVYYYQIIAGEYRDVKKMILLR
jgi:hypothetical protein